MSGNYCFVTVGTTKFDALVEKFSSRDIHDALRNLGVERVVLQIGRGDVEPRVDEAEDFLPLEFFRFCPSIEEYMRVAQVVISHAGAGSIMEALGLRRPLVVVTNDALMDNHQSELADALADRGHLVATTVGNLEECLRTFKGKEFTPYPDKDFDAFPKLVDETVGLRST